MRQYVCECVCVCVYMCVCVYVEAFHFHNSWPISMKLGPHDLNKEFRWHFSQFLKTLIKWRHNGFFVCFVFFFLCGTLTSSFFFCAISFKLIRYVLQLIDLYGITKQRFEFTSSVKNGRRKTGKTVKTKICENRKTKRWYMLMWSSWWRIWP